MSIPVVSNMSNIRSCHIIWDYFRPSHSFVDFLMAINDYYTVQIITGLDIKVSSIGPRRVPLYRFLVHLPGS